MEKFCDVKVLNQHGEETICGRPPFTTGFYGRNLCEIHYTQRFPITASRLIENKPEEDYFALVQADNKKHDIPQMLYAFKNMWNMRKLLGGENRLEYWFKYYYGENPKCEQALELIGKMKWDHETGLKPIEQAFGSIGN